MNIYLSRLCGTSINVVKARWTSFLLKWVGGSWPFLWAGGRGAGRLRRDQRWVDAGFACWCTFHKRYHIYIFISVTYYCTTRDRRDAESQREIVNGFGFDSLQGEEINVFISSPWYDVEFRHLPCNALKNRAVRVEQTILTLNTLLYTGPIKKHQRS